MATLRKLAEIITGADIVAVITQRAKETGMRLDVIVEKAGVSPDQWAAIVALSDDPRITQLRDVARAAGVELAVIESPGGAPWQDRHAPTHHATRSPGLYDSHLVTK